MKMKIYQDHQKTNINRPDFQLKLFTLERKFLLLLKI